MKIQNNSNEDIYASMISGELEEVYGDVPSGESRHFGFSPLLFCDYTVIRHHRDGSDESLLSTTVIANLDKAVEEVIFRYSGNNQWQLLLLDSSGNETMVPQ